MSKRKTINEFEDVRDSVLRRLSVRERSNLLVRASANDLTDLVDRLHDTCPTKRYEQPIAEFTNSIRLLFVMGQRAANQLLRLQLCFENTQLRIQLNDTKANRYELLFWAKMLLARHRQWTRFAEEIIGVSLETWLSTQEIGEGVVAVVRPVVEQAEMLLDQDISSSTKLAAEWVDEEVEIPDEERTVADFGDALYESAAEMHYDSVQRR